MTQVAQSPQHILNAAAAHHQAGRLPEAEALYRQVLGQNPTQPDALHMIGLIAHQQGKHQLALEWIARAVQVQPTALMYGNLGLVFEAMSRPHDAIECFRQAIAMKPDYVDAYINLGACYKDQGKLAEAVDSYGKALALKPDYAEVHFNLAIALQGQRKQDDAIAHYRQAVALKPGLAKAYLNLGSALKEQGRLAEAIEVYRKVLALRPDFAEAHYNLAVALQGQGCLDEEIDHYRKALAARPNHAEAHSNLGNALKAQGKTDEAVRHYGMAIELKPDFAEALYNMGIVLQERFNHDAAAALFKKALALKPGYNVAHHNLAVALQALGRFAEAERHIRVYLAAKPDDAEAICNLAGILRNQGLLEEARICCEQAIKTDPNYARAYASLGNIHIDLGEFDLAQQARLRALDIDPDNSRAWAMLPSLRKMTPDDEPWLHRARALLAQAGVDATSDDAINLEFAIGKYCDDTKRYDDAFASFRHANSMKLLRRKWDGRERHTKLVDQLVATYTADYVRQQHAGSSSSERPALIVGMPRSGTSLTEQIIASHPEAFGAGELSFWLTRPREYQQPELCGDYPPSLLAEAAAEYEQLLQQRSATARRVVDKMPGNFWKLGMITTAFPHARIIHTQRNPIDTCLSIYFQNFTESHAYSADLDDLAHYYREYHRLMAHWRSVLPPERFLDVPYEGLTADQEGWSRRIIAFLGLEWNERCLSFYDTERRVGTASNWQVRQKIYQTSKERWRNYEKHVGPLLNLLELKS